jgi:hypothetical protein
VVIGDRCVMRAEHGTRIYGNNNSYDNYDNYTNLNNAPKKAARPYPICGFDSKNSLKIGSPATNLACHAGRS